MTVPNTANDAVVSVPAPVPVEDMMEVDHDMDAMNEEAMPDEEESLCIPITSSAKAVEQGLFVEVFADELAQTPSSTLSGVLRDEKSDVGLWADAALVYMQRKSPRDSLALLDEANQLYTDDKGKKVRVLAANGIAHLAVQQRNQASGAGTGIFVCSFAFFGFFFFAVLYGETKASCMLLDRFVFLRNLPLLLLVQAPRRSGPAGSRGAAPEGPGPSGRTPTVSSRRRARSTRSSP